jgi:murein endopeptidase
MYLKCRHGGREIGGEIDSAVERIKAQTSRAPKRTRKMRGLTMTDGSHMKRVDTALWTAEWKKLARAAKANGISQREFVRRAIINALDIAERWEPRS